MSQDLRGGTLWAVYKAGVEFVFVSNIITVLRTKTFVFNLESPSNLQPHLLRQDFLAESKYVFFAFGLSKFDSA